MDVDARPGARRRCATSAVAQQPHLTRQRLHRYVDHMLEDADQVLRGARRDGADRVQHFELIGQTLGGSDVIHTRVLL